MATNMVKELTKLRTVGFTTGQVESFPKVVVNTNSSFCPDKYLTVHCKAEDKETE